MKKWIKVFNGKALEYLNSYEGLEDSMREVDFCGGEELDVLVGEEGQRGKVGSGVVVRVRNEIDFFIGKKMSHLKKTDREMRRMRRGIEGYLV